MNEFAEAIPVNNPETILEVPQETVMEELNLTYFYGGESNTFAFYRMPKYLLFDPRFSKLSSDSKILYCCMLDRVSLSISSDWRDKEGRVFIYYSVEEACKLLNKSNRTVTKIMAELDTEKGLGLIERKKQGLGKPDFIFVKNCVISPDQEGKKPAQTKGKNSQKKGNNSQETGENPENYVEKSVDNSVDNFLPVQEVHHQTGNSYSSRPEEIACQDTQKVHAIKTDITNNEQIKTDLLNPTIPPSPVPTYPQFHNNPEFLAQWGEGWTAMTKETKLYVIENEMTQAFQQGKDELEYLMYNYRTDSDTMSLVLDYLMNMEEKERENHSTDDLTQEQFVFKATKLYKQGLLEMLTEPRHTKTKHGYISYSKVIDKVLEHLKFENYSFSVRLDNIVYCTVLEYMDAAAETKIHHKLNYMKTCIWSTFLTGNIYDEQRFHKFATDLNFNGYQRDYYQE